MLPKIGVRQKPNSTLAKQSSASPASSAVFLDQYRELTAEDAEDAEAQHDVDVDREDQLYLSHLPSSLMLGRLPYIRIPTL